MASSSATRIAQLKPLIRSLPQSPFSTNVQLSEALESILTRAATPSTSTGASSSSVDALREAGTQQRLQQMKDAVMRIKLGAASRDYPLSDTLLSPPNDVHYYTRIRNAVHNAENGIKRPWWKTFFSIKGEE
ncbi:hypothetical protein IAR55_006017 [Kwoniella newhampshirensis]|uniref:Uncharacterized protein n=1 Tax=Kwoniella newhampshirensis TaxID=1651941 RepID=A0AAW0YJI1_9TREE